MFNGIKADPDRNTNEDKGTVSVSYAGLNYDLINQLSDSYVKDLLTLYQSSAEGELDTCKNHPSVLGYLTTQIAATGYYPGTTLPLSYLPFEDNRVVWYRAYRGLVKDDLTLKEFGTVQYKRLDGDEYNELMGEHPAKGSKQLSRTPWGLSEEITEVAKCSPSGTKDFRYLPNCLVHLNTRYCAALKELGMEDGDVLEYMDSRISDAILAATLAVNEGSIAAGAYGIAPSVKYPKRKVDTSDEDAGRFSMEAFNSFLSVTTDYYDNRLSSSNLYDIDVEKFIKCSAIVFACKNTGWYLSEKAYNSIDEDTLGVWKMLYPEDKDIVTVADCIAKAELKKKYLADAIMEISDQEVSYKDTKRVYGTNRDYDDTDSVSGFVFHVSDGTSSVYTKTYDSKATPSLVTAFETETASKIFYSCLMGEPIYVSLLQAGGMTEVDITDASTYKNKIINGVSGKSNGVLNDAYLQTGLNSTMISADRIKVLNNAASMLGKACYTWGGGHSGYGIGETPAPAADGMYDFDCSGFVSWCFMKEGFLSSPRVSDGYAPDFYQIDPSELLPGDIFSCSGHVIIFVNIDSDGNYWCIDDGGGGRSTYHLYVEGEVGVRLKTKKLPLITKQGTRIMTTGERFDNRAYICMRARAFDNTDLKKNTYLPSGNSGS